jgi:DNA-directed RNA polymerase specialized sigma24 family protein
MEDKRLILRFKAGSLRSYLTTCVVNLARDQLRAKRRQAQRPRVLRPQIDERTIPLSRAIYDEELRQLADALS